jgi:hypothetical protein
LLTRVHSTVNLQHKESRYQCLFLTTDNVGEETTDLKNLVLEGASSEIFLKGII